jgi:hypothetical protein
LSKKNIIEREREREQRSGADMNGGGSDEAVQDIEGEADSK